MHLMESMAKNSVLQLALTVPVIFCAYLVGKYVRSFRATPAKKEKPSLDATEEAMIGQYTFQTSLSNTKRKAILNILSRLNKRFENACLIKISRYEIQFYLLNNFSLIKIMQSEAIKQHSIFQSQLKQPYLVLDSKCTAKLTNYEYETYMKPIYSRYFKNVREHFINSIVPDEFDMFMEKFKKTQPAACLHVEKIFEILFSITTNFLKHLFQNDKKITKSTLRLMNNVYMMQQRFNLGLFTKINNVDEYSQLYLEFIELIDQEFQIDDYNDYDDFDFNQTDHIESNYSRIKFLFIKNVYLDTMKVFACLTWILHDVSYGCLTIQLNNTSMSELVRRYFIKTTTLDLYCFNPNSSQDDKTPNGFNFLRNRNNLIVLNLVASVCNNKKIANEFLLSSYYSENFGFPDDFIQTVTQCLTRKFIQNFRFKKPFNQKTTTTTPLTAATANNSEELTGMILDKHDLPLVRAADIQYFNVEII